jgi:hypothetical protein
LEQNNNKLVRWIKDYIDLDYMTAESRQSMLDLVKGVGQQVTGIRDYATKAGELEQTLRALDKTLEKGAELPKAVTAALDAVHARLLGPDAAGGVKLSDTLQAVAKLDVDWKHADPLDTAAAAAAFLPSSVLGGGPDNPVGLLAGVVGSAIAAGTAGWAQHKAAAAIAPDATKKFDELTAADQAQHPIAGALGRLAAALPMFELNPVQGARGVTALYKAATGSVLTTVEKAAAAATATQVGIGTGLAVVQPLLMGDSPTKQGIAEAFVQSLILGHPRYGVFGKQAVEAVTAEEAQKDEAAETDRDKTADVYTPAAEPETLTPEQRAQLSILAGKVATGAPIDHADLALKGKLVATNPDAQQFFDEEKTRWANEKVSRLAAAALQRDPTIGDSKAVTEGAGGEMPNQSNPFEGGLAKPPAEPASEPVTTPAPAAPDHSPAVTVTAPAETPAQFSPTEPATKPTTVAPPDAAIAAKDAAPITPSPGSEGGWKEAIRRWPTGFPMPVPGNVPEMVPPKTDATHTVAMTPVEMKPENVPANVHGDPEALFNRFDTALQAGAGQLVSQDSGKGKKGGALFDEPKAGETTKDFTARLDTTSVNADGKRNADGVLKVDNLRSPTTLAMKRGDQVRVSTFYRNNGKEYVSTAGGKGQSLDLALKDGWEIVGSMKGEPTRGHAETYSLDEWNGVAQRMREALGASKRGAEAVANIGEQARDWGRTDANSDGSPTGDETVEAHENWKPGSADFGHDWTPENAKAVFETLTDAKVKTPKDVLDALVAGKHGQLALGLIKDFGIVIDARKPRAAAEKLATILHENFQSKNAVSFERAIRSVLESGVRQAESKGVPETDPGHAPATDPNPASAAAPAGDQLGAGGAPAGADANAERGGQLPEAAAEPAPADAAAASPHPADTATKVRYSSGSGMGIDKPLYNGEQKYEKDRHFGTDTVIHGTAKSGGQATAGPAGRAYQRAGELNQRGRTVATAAVEVARAKGLVRQVQAGKTDGEIRAVSDLIADWITRPEKLLAEAKTAAEKKLAEAVREFHKLVPLVSNQRLGELLHAPLDPVVMLDGIQKRLEHESISEAEYAKQLKDLAARFGEKVDFSDLDEAAAELRERFENRETTGAPLVEEGAGAEAKAYKDDHGNIYKITPVRNNVLGIDIKEGTLTLRADQPPLFNGRGEVPLLERLEAANGLRGHAVTELVGITEDGRLITKQPNLGRVEPQAADLERWAKENGHKVLPQQMEDERFGGDSNVMPLMSDANGEKWLHLDYNGRNSRMLPDGSAVPFDLVSHRLSLEEQKAISKRFSTRFSSPQEQIAQLRPTAEKTIRAAAATEQVLRAMGVQVHRVIDPLVKHFAGQYKEEPDGKGRVRRVITWVCADVNKPTRESYVALMHEGLHLVFARETPERQAMGHQAIENANNAELGIGDYAEHVDPGRSAPRCSGSTWNCAKWWTPSCGDKLKLETGNLKPEGGNRKVENGNLKSEIGNWKSDGPGAQTAIDAAGFPAHTRRTLGWRVNHLRKK